MKKSYISYFEKFEFFYILIFIVELNFPEINFFYILKLFV